MYHHDPSATANPEKKITQSRNSPSCTYAVMPTDPGQLLSVQTGSSPPPSASSVGSAAPRRQISSVASKASLCDRAGTNPTLAARMQPKIAEREAEVAALTAEVAALQRAAGS